MATKPIDINALRKEELAKFNKTYTFKEIPRTELYNALQDLRHIILIDIRSKNEFESSSIRGSYHLENANKDKDTLIKYFNEVADKYKELEQAYKTKPIRRIVIINNSGEKYDENDERIKFVLDCIKEYKDFDKVFYLKDGFQSFQEKYPFLCVDTTQKDVQPLPKMQDVTNNKDILSDTERKWFYALSRFPTEIIEGKLFIGSTANSNNKSQMNDLKIKSILEFISKEDQKIAEFKTKEFSYQKIVMNNETQGFIDFKEICTHIDNMLSNPDSHPILICDSDGDSISACIAVAYLMWSKKASFQMASMSVFQKRSVANPHKYLYTMLSTWNPAQEKPKSGNIESSLLK